MSDPIDELDAALADFTPGIDRAVRYLTIDQVDLMAEYYLRQRSALPPVQPNPLGADGRNMPVAWQVRNKDRWLLMPADWSEAENLSGRVYRPLYAIPSPTDVDLARAALEQPVVRALVEAAYGTLDAIDKYNAANKTAIVGGPPMRLAKALGAIKAALSALKEVGE